MSKDTSLQNMLFAIDAGHGGKDPGAVNGVHHEADTTLKLSKMLSEELKRYSADTLLTRTSDAFVGLSKRASIANAANATAFISIHLNASENKPGVRQATGFETLVYSSPSRAATLAEHINRHMKNAVTWPDRGIKITPNITVLAKTKMPAVLVEVGFISNDEESKAMLTPNVQVNIVNAITQGIVSYYVQ